MTYYHEGERAIQARANVSGMAARVAGGIRTALVQEQQAFLRAQHLLIAAGLDARGHPWATLLVGEPGFVNVPDPHTVVVTTPRDPDVPLSTTASPLVGLLAIDLDTLRRTRVNGILSLDGDVMRVREVYGNCPKYIRRREARHAASPVLAPARRAALTRDDIDLIERADTFFLASAHPTGADASHRGGPKGFVRVTDGTHLTFPDYAGNTMFNTLGNIETTGRAGLLFVDFELDRVLHLTGRAEVTWNDDRLALFPGAERLLDVSVEETLDLRSALGRTWVFLDASPHHPA